MVEVAVSEEDEVGFDFLGLDRGGGGVVEEGVDEQAVAFGFQEEAGVAKPGGFDGHDGYPSTSCMAASCQNFYRRGYNGRKRAQSQLLDSKRTI